MEINLYVVLIIIFIHWVGDFVIQTEYQATNKSSNNRALLNHTINYSVVWLLPICVLIGIENRNQSTEFYVIHSLAFVGITFLFHTITDYFTSKLNTKLATKATKDGKWHNFFVGIGFDQVLHYIQLFLTYQFLK